MGFELFLITEQIYCGNCTEVGQSLVYDGNEVCKFREVSGNQIKIAKLYCRNSWESEKLLSEFMW